MYLQIYNPNPFSSLTQPEDVVILNPPILSHIFSEAAGSSSILTRGGLISQHYTLARICSQVQEILFFNKD